MIFNDVDEVILILLVLAQESFALLKVSFNCPSNLLSMLPIVVELSEPSLSNLKVNQLVYLYI